MNPVYSLEVLQGRIQGAVFELTRRETVLGRGSSADIDLQDPEASRLHCLIAKDKGGLRIEDQGSANGVFVNGCQVERGELNPGDLIRVGTTELRLSAADHAASKGSDEDASPRGEALGQSFRSRLASLSWSVTILCLMLAAAILAHALATRPLLSVQLEVVEDKALRRATVLTLALAAMNQDALRLGDELLLDTESVTQHEGVLEVFVYDRGGRILAPLARFHETPTDMDTLRAVQSEVFVQMERAPGIFDLAEPIRVYNQDTGKFDKIGTARVVFSVRRIADSLESGSQSRTWISLIMLLLGAALLAKLVELATTRKILALRDDVEAVMKGDGAELRGSYQMSALDRLAGSVNRCLIKLTTVRADEPGPGESGAAVPGCDHAGENLCGLLSESVTDGILMADSQGDVVLVNTEFERILGGESGNLRGRHFLEAFTDQPLLAAVLKLIQQAMSAPHGRAAADVVAEQGGFRVRVAVEKDAQAQDGYRHLVVALQAVEKHGEQGEADHG